MATINDVYNEIDRIEAAKEAIEDAIEERGVEIQEGARLGDIPQKIREIPGPVQADWNEGDTSAPDYIKNKPTIPEERVLQSSADIPSTFINVEKTSSEMAELLGISDSAFLGLLSGNYLAIKFQDGLASVLESVETGTPIGLLFEAKRGYYLIIPSGVGYKITRFSNNPLYMERTTNKVTSISRSSNDVDYPTAKAVYTAINPLIGTNQPGSGMLPNKIYNFGSINDSMSFLLAAAIDENIVNHYYWMFDTNASAPAITWPSEIIKWFGGSAPQISANKHYEISVINGIAVAMEV